MIAGKAIKMESIWIGKKHIMAVLRVENQTMDSAMTEIRSSFKDYDVSFIRTCDDKNYLCMVASQPAIAHDETTKREEHNGKNHNG